MQVQDLRPAAKACPFFVVTLLGERAGALDRPNHDGKPVKLRLCTNGALTMLSAQDVDWALAEKANARGAAQLPTPGLAPAPMQSSLSGFAKEASLHDADTVVKRNQTLFGKMKIGDREISFDDSAPFFGRDSVAQYLQLSASTWTRRAARASGRLRLREEHLAGEIARPQGARPHRESQVRRLQRPGPVD